MAAIVQSQQSQAQEESAARQFWNSLMGKHPILGGWLAIAGEVIGFFLNGHALIRFGQWVVRVTGSIAETALLFAVLWISGTSVAPHLVELEMSAQTMQYFVSVALIALALIPEIILANAIVNALGHIHTASQQRTAVAWAWAVLFTLPTVMFLGLTAYTLNTLVQNGGTFVQASTSLVGLRCFAGWTYGLLEMVFAGVGRRTLKGAQLVITPAQPIPAAAPSVPAQTLAVTPIQQASDGVIQEMKEQIARLNEQVVLLQTPPTAPEIAPAGASENTLECEVVSDENAHESDTPIAPVDAPETLTQERNNITLMSDCRSAQPRTKTNTVNRSEKARKAASIIKRNPHISAPDLAKKAQISTSYARKLLVNQ
jgi:hypothetical protein